MNRMTEDKQTKIDIPESVDAYRITLFWGLTITQIVLVFIATLFVGFGISAVVSHHTATSSVMFAMAIITLLGILEIRGRNFYKHVSFIVAYYKDRPKVLIYHHHAPSGNAGIQSKQLVYQQEDNSKMIFMIFGTIAGGVILLILTIIFLYHAIHP